MAHEATSSDTGCELPKAKGLVPGCGEGVGTVRGDDLKTIVSFFTSSEARCPNTYAVRHNVRVAVETSFRVSVVLLIPGKIPDDEGLITAAREKHVGAARLLASTSPSI